MINKLGSIDVIYRFMLGFLLFKILIVVQSCVEKDEKTKAEESSYNQDITEAVKSHEISKSDLAWHAQNTYGWDCAEVSEVGDMQGGDYYMITCSNGTKLRVYPRVGKHPKITNESSTYK